LINVAIDPEFPQLKKERSFQDIRYLKPYLDEVRKEREEKENWEAS